MNNLDPGTYSNCSLRVTDFSDNSSLQLNIPSFTITYPSDFNLDRTVNIFDYNILLGNFGQTNCGNQADANFDCAIDIFDYNVLLQDFGRGI
jgi:hypothetical protein